MTSERSRHIVTSGEIREQWINPPMARNRIYAWWRHFTTTTRMLRGKRLYSVFFLLWRIVRDTNLAAKCILVAGDVIVQMSEVKKHTYAVFTRDTFTRGKLTFYCEMHLPHVNVSPVNTSNWLYLSNWNLLRWNYLEVLVFSLVNNLFWVYEL